MYLTKVCKMKNKTLQVIIENICEEVIEEQNVPRQELAHAYVKAIKRKNPKLYDVLMRQALFAVKSVKKDVKPRHTVELMHKLLRLDQASDPRKSADTHGVRLFIDHLIDDATFAGKAKRFYQQAIDALIRQTYGGK